MATKNTEIQINNKKIVAAINLQKAIKGVKKDSQVVGETFYDVATTKHSNWLVIDLETGQRGWYPGKQEE